MPKPRPVGPRCPRGPVGRFASLASLVVFVVVAAAVAGRSTAAEVPAAAAPTRDDHAPPPPLKVFILAGQSNMQGHAQVRTMDAMALSPETRPELVELLGQMQDADGDPVVCPDVWISEIGSSNAERTGRLTAGFGASRGGPKIGPEFSFGLTMRAHLGEPMLIIKTAWGGRSLHTDFRPPSAGPHPLTGEQVRRIRERGDDVDAAQAERAEATGRAWRDMIGHVHAVLTDVTRVHPDIDASGGVELAGFVWFQGWNDMVDGGVYPRRGEPGSYDAYSELLTTFIGDLRRELEAPELPVVIGVMGVGGPLADYPPNQRRHVAVHGAFRRAMAAPAGRPEFGGRVVAVETAPFWDAEVMALRAREAEFGGEANAIREMIAAGERDGDDGQAAIDRFYAEAFDARELALLRESTSNAEYHYLGSARILAPIGAAFADALHAIIRSPATSPSPSDS